MEQTTEQPKVPSPEPMKLVNDDWDYDNSDEDEDFVCDEKPWPEPEQLLEAAKSLDLPERELRCIFEPPNIFDYEEFDYRKYDYPSLRDMPDYDPDKMSRKRDVNGPQTDDYPSDESCDESEVNELKDQRIDKLVVEDDSPSGSSTKNGYTLSLYVKYARENGQVFIGDPPVQGVHYFRETVFALPYENVHLWHGQLIRRNPTRSCRYKKVYPLCPRKVIDSDKTMKL